MTFTAGTRLGRYTIHSLLGVGGMGEVYLAEDTRLRRKMALKVLQAGLTNSRERLKRFEQEAIAASALNHPNIITIYEIGQEQGTHFIATEYIDGETLRQLMTSRQIDWGEVLDISLQLASALAAAHTAGIIHRDIKPENIMVRHDQLVKVLDFGLVKLTESYKTNNEDLTLINSDLNMIMGTVRYMSPEQARGLPVDERTDIWSLGVVLYEMLALRVPFTGDTVTDILISIVQKELPPLRTFAPDAPDELLEIISRMLCKNLAERYQIISDMQADLRSLKQRLDFEKKLGSVSTPVELKERIKAQDRGEKGAGKYPTQVTTVALPGGDRSLHANNLSQELTPLVGRKDEIEVILKMLRREDVRLVTLTGIGGTGKTRLARAVARAMLRDFPDGVFFIDLTPISDAELVATAIAQPLGVKEAGGKLILEVLNDYLRDKKMLLVIDNFEQVTAAAPQIAELLSAAGQLKILITSRTLLHLSSEKEFVVPTLSVPADVSQVSLDELLKYEAIKLFVERAGSAKPNFALTKENANSVAEICARLDGLPLAIELAAARVKILSPQAILTKLEHRLKLLTGGARDLPARQQTMRGAVEWSYDLLDEDEKRLFRRLSVFAGGLTFEAAEAVCANYDSDEEYLEVLDLITSLVDKSLLVAKDQADGEMRFRMLETVREYARESLEKNNEAEAALSRHAGYFLALGEAAEPHLQGEQAVEWLNRLEEEHDNLRDALGWSLENDAATAARLAAAIRVFWTFHGHLTEGRKWIKAAFERGSLAVPAAVRFKLLNGLGLRARLEGDYEAARKAYEEGLAEGRAANDLRQIVVSSNGLGSVAVEQGDFAAARRFIEEALAISRQLDDKPGIALALSYLGDLARVEGDNTAARPLSEEALTIFRQLGNKEGVSSNRNNLGAITYNEGDLGAARSHFTESLATTQELRQKISIAYSLDGFAALAAEREDTELGAQLAGMAEQLREQVGFKMEAADRLFRDAYIAKLKTKMDETAFAKACEQGRKLKLEEAVALCFEKEGVKINR